MAVEERDPFTGHRTTGHEWNGIKELNTPVPKPVYVFLILFTAFSVIYWVLMPAWPLGRTYTKGLLGQDERNVVGLELKAASMRDAAWGREIERGSFENLLRSEPIMHIVRERGSAIFGDNCAACHGANARGNIGFPSLLGANLLWGSSPEQVMETIRVGINSLHAETRTSQMPAFGRDGLLDRHQIGQLASYVRGLSASRDADADAIAAFQQNCATCHGEAASGNVELGAPNLSDADWLYGSDLQAVYRTIWNGRQGHMPSWEGRLSPVQIKLMALFVSDLRSRADVPR